MIRKINVSGKGNGTLDVDASMLSAGVYNYSLVIEGSIVSTKTMVAGK
jgi:hypothetical protein